MYKIGVAGNPNSGKTCVFNNLTGSSQRVGNYPGVTVDFTEGIGTFGTEKVKVVDLPGTYSLTAYSQEEIVARDFIVHEEPDVLINVVDAGNLERNLYLTVQLIELGVPIVIALNMYDVAEKKGMIIDCEKLSSIFGVKFVPTVATKQKGMKELAQACIETVEKNIKPKTLVYSHEIEDSIRELENEISSHDELTGEYPSKWFTLKLFEGDEDIKSRLENCTKCDSIQKALEKAEKKLYHHSGEDPVTAMVESRYGTANGAARAAVSVSPGKKRELTEKIDSIVCNKFAGPIVLLAVVFILFQAVFNAADGEWIPLFSDRNWISPAGLVETFFDYLASFSVYIKSEALASLYRDGVIGGVGGIMSFVPLIFFMFLFISILEDTGYIARIAFLLDRILRVFGLQGKSILAMIVSGGLGGGGCAVPGVMATRTLREEKDRLVTILVAPLMNCGAKLPVYAMLIAAFFADFRGLMMFLLWFLSWVFALCSAFVIRKFIIKGEQTPFVMELPVYHMPTFRGVLMHTWNRTWMFIRKAGTIILAINIIMWFLMYFPRADLSPTEKEKTHNRKTFEQNMLKQRKATFLTGKKLDETTKCISKTEKLLEKFISEKPENYAEMLKISAELRKEFNKKSLQYLRNKLPDYDKKQIEFAMKTVLLEKHPEHSTNSIIKSYEKFREKQRKIADKQAQKQLLSSAAGKIGRLLEPVTKFSGFDWQDNIALIGGFAAKEVVVTTLATAYAMGEVPSDSPSSLSDKLKNDPGWTPLGAFAFMIFVMIYAPCFATIAAIKKETGSWKWAVFSTVYSTILGFVLAVLIYQTGNLF